MLSLATVRLYTVILIERWTLMMPRHVVRSDEDAWRQGR